VTGTESGTESVTGTVFTQVWRGGPRSAPVAEHAVVTSDPEDPQRLDPTLLLAVL